MRTRTNSIVTAFVLLSLVSGAVGCRSNGGPWYNPKSYAFHNPFGSSEAPPFDAEGTAQANQKPSIGAQPSVNTPPGGYTNHQDEAKFLAGGNKEVVTQYGVTSGTTVASTAGAATTPHSAPQSAYPETPYNPYAPIDSTTAGMTPQPGVYQGTNLHTAGAPQAGTTYPGTAPVDPMTYPGSVPAVPPVAAPSSIPAGSYSPYGAPAAPVQNAAPIYGDPNATNPYAQPATQPGYTAQPSVPQSYAMPQTQGYGAPADPYQGYNAAPSAYPTTTVPQGF